jgi:hypothetical protein
MIMIQEIPFAIYINDTDVSSNSLPSSVEIIPHKPIIIIEHAIVKRSCYRFWVINKFAYICNMFIIFIFMISIIIAMICVLFPLNRIKK